MKSVKVYGLFLFIVAMVPGQVFAHALWKPGSTTTPPRSTDLFANLKYGPCGGSGPNTLLPRSNTPLTYTAGSTITTEFIETIYHPGEFWISYSEANEENFKFKKIIPHSAIQKDTYSKPYTLPLELCTDCTLQLIQVMKENPANPTFYYSCSDIILQSPDINARITQQPVSQPTIAPGNNSITLNWVNPNNTTFYKTLIVGNAAGTPPNTDPVVDLDRKLFKVGDKTNVTKNNDVVVYNGKLNTAIISSLMNNNQYTYQIFAYDINLNYSKATTLSAIPSTTNVAPTVALDITQGIYTSTNVTPDGGNIVIKATVTDGNVNDNHTFAWVSNNFTDGDGNIGDNAFTIKSEEITPLPIDSTYTITVTATDEGGLKGTNSVVLTLKANPPPIAVDNGVINNITDNGGCTVSKSAKFDPLLLLLTLLSLVVLLIRTSKQN